MQSKCLYIYSASKEGGDVVCVCMWVEIFRAHQRLPHYSGEGSKCMVCAHVPWADYAVHVGTDSVSDMPGMQERSYCEHVSNTL